MNTNFNAFIGSCRPLGHVFSATGTSSRCGASRRLGPPSHHPSHPPRHADFRRVDSSARKKTGHSSALEKRSKQYFFKLLSAARKRDKRLLASVMKSLGADKDYLELMRSADPELAGSFHVQDVLLKAASRCGQPILADRLFTTMLARGQHPTQHTTGAFLDALKRSRQADRCVSVYAEMMDSGVHLGDVCFNIVVSALVQDGNFAGGMDMLERASTEWGVNPDAYTFNIFFSAAAKQNSSASRAAAKKAGTLMSQFGVVPDRVTINAQIDYAIKQGKPSEAIEIFERALQGGFPGVVPDVITFNVGISAYMALDMQDRAFEVLDEMNRRGVYPRADTFNSILTGLSKAGGTLGVIEVFNKYMRQDDVGHGDSVAPTLVTYNLVLQALCLENDKGQARRVAAEMRHRGVKPDNITLAALVRLQYSREDVYEVMEIARKLRIRPSLTFLNSCIRALGDHSDVYGACQVMERIKALKTVEPDVISYNSLIYALVQEPWVFEVIQDARGVNGGPKLTTAAVPCLEDTPWLTDSDDSELPPATFLPELPPFPGSTARFDGMIGAEAALLLLEEMKSMPDACGVSPDIFTYTTVISGAARAEDARRSGRHAKQWWLTPGTPSGSEEVDSGHRLTSTALCNKLYLEAVQRDVQINGKICNAVMVGFGADLTGAISFWRRQVRPALLRASDGVRSDRAAAKGVPLQKRLKKDLLSAYCGLLYVCGRAQRPDAAMKIVFALRKEGITPSSTLSNTYFKAKKDSKVLEDDPLGGPAPFRMMRLLDRQLENALEVECGVSKHAEPLDLPIERIRIKF